MRSMRTSWVVSAAAALWIVVFTGSAALAGAYPAAAGAAASAGRVWRTAHEVRGLAALNAGGDAQVLSVSCASAGNCAAGGYYENARAFYEAFVVSEVNGAWGRAAVPKARPDSSSIRSSGGSSLPPCATRKRARQSRRSGDRQCAARRSDLFWSGPGARVRKPQPPIGLRPKERP